MNIEDDTKTVIDFDAEERLHVIDDESHQRASRRMRDRDSATPHTRNLENEDNTLGPTVFIHKIPRDQLFQLKPNQFLNYVEHIYELGQIERERTIQTQKELYRARWENKRLREEIDSKKLMANKLNCAVCWGERTVNISLACGHTFCADCLLQVIELSCPVCRRPMRDPRPVIFSGHANV